MPLVGWIHVNDSSFATHEGFSRNAALSERIRANVERRFRLDITRHFNTGKPNEMQTFLVRDQN